MPTCLLGAGGGDGSEGSKARAIGLVGDLASAALTASRTLVTVSGVAPGSTASRALATVGGLAGLCLMFTSSHLPRLEVDARIDECVDEVGHQVNDKAQQGED